VVVFMLLLGVIVVPKGHAATLNNTSVVELAGGGSPMIAGAGNELAIAFQPVTTGVPSSITLAFNSPWTTNSGAVNSGAITSSGACTTYFSTASAVTLSSSSGSGSTITMATSSSLTAGTLYCITLTTASTVTNPTAGAYTATLTAGSDSETVALDVLSTGSNAYSVTVTVPSTFTLSLSPTTDSFSSPGTTLSPSSVETTTGVTASVATNALDGWFLWAEDANSGLHSTNASYTIPSAGTVSCSSNTTFASGSAAYGLGVSAHNTANYAYTSSTHGGCLSSATYYEIANDTVASSDTTVLHELATISATTPAAPDYTDTITVIGAGSF